MRNPTLEECEATARAKRAWSLMDDNEKAAVRIGMLPHWTVLEGLGSRGDPTRIDHAWPALHGRGTHRLFAVAMFDCAKRDGGMIC